MAIVHYRFESDITKLLGIDDLEVNFPLTDGTWIEDYLIDLADPTTISDYINTFAHTTNAEATITVYASDVLANIVVTYDYDNSYDTPRVLGIFGIGDNLIYTHLIQIASDPQTDYIPPVLSDPTSCDVCQEIELEACQSAYSITTGLTPDTAYTVVLTDRANREYTQDITSDGSGNIEISMELFPDGFATPENSPVEMVVRATADSSDETLTANNTTYPCININYIYRVDTTPIVLLLFVITDALENILVSGHNLII